jgi:hypothetical protein
MAIFRQSLERSIVKDRDTAQANCIRLATKLTDAEAAVTARRREAQQLALNGADDGVLNAAEATLRGALDRQTTINAASTEAGKLLALLESQLAGTLDKKLRATTAAELTAMSDDLSQASDGVDIATTALSKIATRAAMFISEAKGLEIFATSSLVQVPEASNYIGLLLRERARQVIDGSAPASLPTPEAAFVPTIPVKPVTRRLFSLKPVSWTDGSGDLRVAQRWNDVDLPIPAAEKAIERVGCRGRCSLERYCLLAHS